ncbi:MAG: hypothetical protein VB118_04970 [Oscillospiraceae bacterium]|nr:hypothetical protein [Oscillospiraceae bacterium]
MDKKKNSHLENAMDNAPVASVNDRTGYVNTPPESKAEANNIAELVNATVTPGEKKDKSKKESKENKEKKEKKK